MIEKETHDVNSVPRTKPAEHCAVVMLNKTLSNKAAAKRYQNKGYRTLVIDPLPNETPTDQCIHGFMNNVKGMDKDSIVICALESNYSFSGQVMCNTALFDFVCDNYHPFYILAYSATPASLDKAKEWMKQKKATQESTEQRKQLPKLLCIDFTDTQCYALEARIPNLSLQRSSGSESPFSRRVSIF